MTIKNSYICDCWAKELGIENKGEKHAPIIKIMHLMVQKMVDLCASLKKIRR